MARPKGSKDISTIIRGAFVRAVNRMEAEGKPLSTMIYDELQKNPLATLKAVAHYCPRDLMLAGQIDTTLQINVLRYADDQPAKQLEAKAVPDAPLEGSGTRH